MLLISFDHLLLNGIADYIKQLWLQETKSRTRTDLAQPVKGLQDSYVKSQAKYLPCKGV